MATKDELLHEVQEHRNRISDIDNLLLNMANLRFGQMEDELQKLRTERASHEDAIQHLQDELAPLLK